MFKIFNNILKKIKNNFLLIILIKYFTKENKIYKFYKIILSTEFQKNII